MPTSTHLLPLALALDNPERTHRLLALAEDQWFDRKSIRVKPSRLAETLVGLANADGGAVLIGLSDGVVEGTDGDTARVNELRQAHMQHCEPAVPATHSLVECIDAGGRSDHLLLIEVRAGETVYATRAEVAYLRVGDETRKLSYHQRQELTFDRGQGAYEARPVRGTDAASLDTVLAEQYADSMSAPDVWRLLLARGLAEGEQLTVAGALAFGELPQRHFPEAYVRVIRYRGERRGSGSRQEITADVRIEGPLARQLMGARAAIELHQPRRRALGRSGRFEELPLVPEDAWLEGLVNAVVHRSYSLAGDHVRVAIFTDRIEVESPGRFPGIFAADDPSQTGRYARNPRIARVCAEQQFGQELGEGIRRMFDEMRLVGLADPLYTQSAGGVRLTLLADPADRALEARLPRDGRAIIAVLRDAGALSTSQVAEAISVSRITARKRLEALREEGLIEWDGVSARDPHASWRLPGP